MKSVKYAGKKNGNLRTLMLIPLGDVSFVTLPFAVLLARKRAPDYSV